MQRRGGRGQVKGRRQGAIKPKTRKASSAAASTAVLQKQLDQRTRERDEPFEQQTALSEILGVISSSPSDLAPVFNAILANTTRLCKGNLAALWLYDGEFLAGKGIGWRHCTMAPRAGRAHSVSALGGKSGQHADIRLCLLLTQKGHRQPVR